MKNQNRPFVERGRNPELLDSSLRDFMANLSRWVSQSPNCQPTERPDGWLCKSTGTLKRSALDGRKMKNGRISFEIVSNTIYEQ